MYLKTISILLILFVLSACQNQPEQLKSQPPTEPEIISDSQWQQAQQGVLSALQEHDIEMAIGLLQPMLLQAGDMASRWQYIRMALAALPVDKAQPVVEKALSLPAVNQSSEQLFNFSRLLMQQHNTSGSLDTINQAINLNRQQDYVYWRARLLAISDELSAAKTDYQWLLAQSPDEIDYLSQYAALLMQMGELSEAETFLAGHNNEPRLQYQHILLLLQQEKFKAAEPVYDALISNLDFASLTAKEQLSYGELAFWLEDYDNALRMLTKINDAEYVYEAKLLMGRVYLALEDPEKALVLFKQVQNAPEEFSIPSFQMASEVYMRQKQPNQAIGVLSEGLRFFQDQPDLLYTRALLNSQLDNIPAAEKDFKVILKADPEHADALNALGYTWANHDMKLDKAFEYIQKAHELKPDNKAILDSMGWVYYKRGDLLKAAHYLREALNDDRTDAETLRHLIVVLEAQNKSDEAQFYRNKLDHQGGISSP